MKTAATFFYWASFVFLVLCLVFCFISFDKYIHYNDGDYGQSKNAYVGGDAYNLIINGTYFTAFAVYSVGCGIGSLLSLFFGFFCSYFDGYEEQKANRLANPSASTTETSAIQETFEPEKSTQKQEENAELSPAIYATRRRRMERQTINQTNDDTYETGRDKSFTSAQQDNEWWSDTPDKQ